MNLDRNHVLEPLLSKSSARSGVELGPTNDSEERHRPVIDDPLPSPLPHPYHPLQSSLHFPRDKRSKQYNELRVELSKRLAIVHQDPRHLEAVTELLDLLDKAATKGQLESCGVRPNPLDTASFTQ